MTTAAQLKRAQAAFSKNLTNVEQARVKRNELIIKAKGEGMPQVEIANATGLGKARIGQILLNGVE